MRRFAHLALPLLVFLVALAAGAWLSIGRRAAAFSAGVEQRLATAPKVASPVNAPTDRAFPTDEEMFATIMSAVAEDEPLLRAHRLHETLGRLSSAELAALFTKAALLDDRERRDTLLRVVLARWAALDPAAVEAAVGPYLQRLRTPLRYDWRSPDAAVAWAWAAAMPERALAEAMTSPDAPWAADLARQAINALADGDPLKQVESLARLPANRLRAEMCQGALRALAEKDSAAAETYLDLLPDVRTRTKLQAEILGKLAARDPAAGLARLAALAPTLHAGTDGLRVVTEIMRAAAIKDPAAALSAVDGLPAELQKSAVGSVLVGWAGEHPVEALAWGAAHDVVLSDTKSFVSFGDYGASWQNVLQVAFEKDASGTLAWVRTQPPSSERDALLRQGIWGAKPEEKLQIYAELTPQGQASAAGELVRTSLREGVGTVEAWVKAQPPGQARASAIQALALSQVNNAPERLATLAADWPAGPDRDAALRGAVSYYTRYNTDPPRALEVARGIAAPSTRESAFEGIAQSWIYSDTPAARTWITTAPELSSEQRRILLRLADEQ